MRLLVDPGALRSAADQLTRQARTLEADAAEFLAAAHATVPEIGRASFHAAGDTADAADKAMAKLVGDLRRLATALIDVADNYQANDRRLVP